MIDRQHDEFEKIFDAIEWVEIPNCPGRYLLDKKYRKEAHNKDPNNFLKSIIEGLSLDLCSFINSKMKTMKQGYEEREAYDFVSTKCKDKLRVILIKGGCTLSYIKDEEGKVFVHTLNNLSGMTRKFKQLEISLPEQDSSIN